MKTVNFVFSTLLLLPGIHAFASDCNRNGVDDSADIASGTSPDCNGNGVPDECDVTPGTFGFPSSLTIPDVGYLTELKGADLNADGVMDLAAITPGDDSDDVYGSVSVFLGLGGAAFGPAVQIDMADYPASIAGTDVNGDGRPDLVVGSGVVSVLFNLGGGAFAPPAVLHGVPGLYRSLAAGDLDHDGDVDLAVLDERPDEWYVIVILANDGDSTFAVVEEHPVAGDAVEVLDLDRDGNLDLLADHYYLRGRGDGTFADPVPLFPQAGECYADLNGDGFLDLVAVDLWDEGESQIVHVLLNDGQGALLEPVDYEVLGYPLFVASADLDGDGALDLFSAGLGLNSVSVLLNKGDGTFREATSYAIAGDPQGYAALDLDGDGDLDLAFTGGGSLSFLSNRGDGSFDAATSLPGGGSTMAASDLDGDGIVDLAASCGATLSVHRGRGDGTFDPAVTSFYPAYYDDCLTGADLDGDGDPDLVSAAPAGSFEGYAIVRMNRGDATFADRIYYPDDGWPMYVTVADLDGDRDLDIATANWGSSNFQGGNVSVLLGDGTGAFGTATAYASGGSMRAIVSGDVDRDGDIDLVSAGGHQGAFVFKNLGHGTFGPAVDVAPEVRDGALALFDPHGDGVLDLASSVYEAIKLFENDGGGGFQPGQKIELPGDRISIVAADIDSDGVLDLAAASTTWNEAPGWVSVIRGAGEGAFGTPLNFSTGPTPNSLVAADLNRDGCIDIAVNSYQGDYGAIITILHGRPWRPFSRDLNGNGVPDECEATAFIRLDANADGEADLSDAVRTLLFLFLGGADLECPKSADADDSGVLDLSDAVFGLTYLFLSGSMPARPFPDCGIDGTPDGLTCASYPPCRD
jgi:hypothetical protein